jgi:hypothetical protein
MIISHKHKFIFIKSRKTAGTSIECFLSGYVGPNDIVTRIEEDRKREVEWHVPQNHDGFQTHNNAEFIMNYDKEIFENYFTFTAIRNPWDRIVSYFHYSNPKKPKKYFKKWLLMGSKDREKLTPFYKVDGKQVVDDFIRFEHLEQDLKALCLTLGLKYNEKFLIKTKHTTRPDKSEYKTYYNNETESFIREAFKEEIKDFKYEF